VAYQSLADMFISQAKRYGEKVLYRFPRNSDWESYSWNEALLRVREIALGLLSLEARRGDRVAIFSSNRVEWNLVDWANICIGTLTVPIYSSSTSSQVLHVIGHSEPTVLFVESREMLKRLNPLHPSVSRIKVVVIMDSGKAIPAAEDRRVISIEALREWGRLYEKGHPGVFERLADSLRPEDDLTLIYTSGTTGEPKGVLTTHGHYLFMISAVDSAIPSTDQDVTLHFLPSAHSFGRLEHFMAVAKGWTVGFARSVEAVAKDLRTIRPTIIFSVPRIYEVAYNRIRLRADRSNALRRLMFRSAVSIGKRCSRNLRQHQRASLGLRLAWRLANRLVFSNVLSAFGGNLRLAISGGAPLPSHLAEFFHSVGIPILEGYGLTETATVSHVNRLHSYKFGTVGFPLEGVKCRISDDGEILLQGPNIFKEYYRDFIGTQEAIDADGWFHTGDVGEIDEEGFLRITDRKKDLIVTSGAKKVAPQKIENLLKTDPLISQVMVVGSGQRHLLALITLDRSRIVDLAEEEGITFSSSEEMISHPWVLSRIKERIRETNKGLAPYETVRRFCILTHDFTVEDEELTPTLKLRRGVIMDRYKELIEEMYGRPRFEL
jgi:long-chain acyl-CoA synthetase